MATIYGTTGSNTIADGAISDTIFAGSDNDFVFGLGGDDFLFGEAGDDALFGEGGNDALFSGDGNGYLDSGLGNDYLYGYAYGSDSGTDYDSLTGGVGADAFVLGDLAITGDQRYGEVAYLGVGYAIITDFNSSEGDKLVVYGKTSYSLTSLDFGVGSSNQDTGIFYNNDLIAIVQDTPNVLYPTDFIFVV